MLRTSLSQNNKQVQQKRMSLFKKLNHKEIGYLDSAINDSQVLNLFVTLICKLKTKYILQKIHVLRKIIQLYF